MARLAFEKPFQPKAVLLLLRRISEKLLDGEMGCPAVVKITAHRLRCGGLIIAGRLRSRVEKKRRSPWRPKDSYCYKRKPANLAGPPTTSNRRREIKIITLQANPDAPWGACKVLGPDSRASILSMAALLPTGLYSSNRKAPRPRISRGLAGPNTAHSHERCMLANARPDRILNDPSAKFPEMSVYLSLFKQNPEFQGPDLQI